MLVFVPHEGVRRRSAALLQREREREDAARPWLALDPDASAVRDDDPARDREPEAGPLPRLAGCLPEPIEDVCLHVFADPWPRVGNGEDALIGRADDGDAYH